MYLGKSQRKSEKIPTNLLYLFNFSHFNEVTGNANV